MSDLEIPLAGGSLPLLHHPGPDATESEWASVFPLEALPELPDRSSDYYAEPWNGIILVSLVCAFLVTFTSIVAKLGGGLESEHLKHVAHLCVSLIWLWTALAASCVAYLLFGATGEIKRSASTCYPIPEEVVQLLSSASGADSCELRKLDRNIEVSDGSSYCVRCLVWRPKQRRGAVSHHCNTCQRCVSGFDHHCGVFGRCITTSNLPCFYLLTMMAVAGVLTAGFAHVSLDAEMPGVGATTPTPATLIRPMRIPGETSPMPGTTLMRATTMVPTIHAF